MLRFWVLDIYKELEKLINCNRFYGLIEPL
jgi:hypothetical protein